MRFVLALATLVVGPLGAAAQDWRVPPRYDELRIERSEFDAFLGGMKLADAEAVEARAVFAAYDFEIEQLRKAWYDVTRWIDSVHPMSHDAAADSFHRVLDGDTRRAGEAWLDDSRHLESAFFDDLASIGGRLQSGAALERDDRMRARQRSALDFADQYRGSGGHGTVIDLIGAVRSFHAPNPIPDNAQRILDDYAAATARDLRTLDRMHGRHHMHRSVLQKAVYDARDAGDVVALQRACAAWVDHLAAPSLLAWRVRNATIEAVDRLVQWLEPETARRLRLRLDHAVNPFLYGEHSPAVWIEQRLDDDVLTVEERAALQRDLIDFARLRDGIGEAVVVHYEALIDPAMTRAMFTRIARRFQGLPLGIDPTADARAAFEEARARWVDATGAVARRVGVPGDRAPLVQRQEAAASVEAYWRGEFAHRIDRFPAHIDSLAAGDEATGEILQTLWRDFVAAYGRCVEHFVGLQRPFQDAMDAWIAEHGTNPIKDGRDFGQALAYHAILRDRDRLESGFEGDVAAVLDDAGRAAWGDIVRAARRERVLARVAVRSGGRPRADLSAVLDGLDLGVAERAGVREAREAYESHIDRVLAGFEESQLERRLAFDTANGVSGSYRTVLEIEGPLDVCHGPADPDAVTAAHEADTAACDRVWAACDQLTDAVAAALPAESAEAFRASVASVTYPAIHADGPVEHAVSLLGETFSGDGRLVSEIERIAADHATALAGIRRGQIDAMHRWEHPDRSERKRREVVRAGWQHGIHDDYTDVNPVIPHLIARRRLEASTCQRLRDLFDDETYANMPPAIRLLVGWASAE